MSRCCPTEKAQRIAVRTQQIIAEETGVTNTVDPMGGSYYIEWLTDELEREALRLLDEVDALGGAVACIETGWMQQHIQDEAYRTERAIAVGDKVIVGVNRYTETEEADPPLLSSPMSGRWQDRRPGWPGIVPRATRQLLWQRSPPSKTPQRLTRR